MRVLLSAIIVSIGLSGCGHMQGPQSAPACNDRMVEKYRKDYSAKTTTLKNKLADKMAVKNIKPEPALELLRKIRALKGQINSSYSKTEKACRALTNCAAAYDNDLTKCSLEQSDWMSNIAVFNKFGSSLMQLDGQVRTLKLEKYDPKKAAEQKKSEANRAKDCQPVVGTVFTECK